MTKNVLHIIVACALISLASCTKNGTTGSAGPVGPVGPAGPSYTGAISGHVSLLDQYGSRVTTGLTNVQLLINGTTTLPVDATGYYIKGSVITGTYSFDASNTGYGSTHINSFQFLADTLNRDIRLSAIPNFSPTAITATKISGSDSVAVTFANDTRPRSCILFINKGATAGGTPDKYLMLMIRTIPANSNKPVTFSIAAQDLTNVGILTGETINISAYGYAVNDASAYEDLATGKGVYTAISATPATATCVAP